MKRSTKYKISSFLCLGIILIGYNQCMNPMSANSKKSSMKFSTKDSVTTSSGGNSNSSTISSEEVKKISIDAFKTTVYPITRARCVSCHGASQTPLHASSNLEVAHNALVDTFKIDFNNIEGSRMVLKLKNDRHNCWGDCNANAAEMQDQITEWKRIIDEKAPDATETTGNVTGKITTETKTIQEILSPENLIDQGTVTLMAESGSLKSPMVKATENNVGYIWAPEGTGTKNLTSSDAGLAYVNFKVTNSDFYKVFMFVNAPDTNADSVYVKVAGSDTKEWHLRSVTRGFEWREVTNTTSFQDSPFYIAGGQNFGVELRQRDDGMKISKIVITNDPTFNPSVVKAMKSTISLPLATLSGVSGSMLDIDIEEYDMYSYKLTNPRIRTSQDLYVKSLKVLINGNYNPQHATYTIVNKKVSAIDGSLSTYSMILLKDKGADIDRLSFSFEHIGTGPAPVATAPTTPTTPTTPVTKITSVAAFQQTLWPVLRARCIGCHGDSQPPLHAHANVTTAHTNVVESALINFANIPASKISTKLKTNRHNCWSDCNSNAAEVEGQITIWKNLSGQ